MVFENWETKIGTLFLHGNAKKTQESAFFAFFFTPTEPKLVQETRLRHFRIEREKTDGRTTL